MVGMVTDPWSLMPVFVVSPVGSSPIANVLMVKSSPPTLNESFSSTVNPSESRVAASIVCVPVVW